MASEQIQLSLTPVGDLASAAGYALSAATSDTTKTATTIGKSLNDPFVLDQLTDRVYELLLEDLRCQRDRVRSYGKERWL